MMRNRVPVAALSTVLSAFVLYSVTALASEKEGTFYGAKPTEYPSWFKESFLSFEEDIAEAKAAGKRLLLVFHQDGCPYCNALVERNLSQKDIEQKVRKHFDVVAINMWGDREVVTVGGEQYTEKTFAAALKVQFTPTLIFFDEQGKVALRLNGYLPPQRFKVALDYVAGRKERELSYHDYVAANLLPGKTGELIKEDFFSTPPYKLVRDKGGKGRPLAVFFEQKDCPNCDILHEKVLADAGTRAIIKQAENVQLDMWSDTPVITPAGKQTTARQWAKELDVKYAPSIVLFNEVGEEVIRTEAFFKVFHTQGVFTYLLTGAYKTEPSFQRFLAEHAEVIREQGRDVDIWRYADEQPGIRE